jgi:hypothetical protein
MSEAATVDRVFEPNGRSIVPGETVIPVEHSNGYNDDGRIIVHGQVPWAETETKDQTWLWIQDGLFQMDSDDPAGNIEEILVILTPEQRAALIEALQAS